ncbi:hypothetical protein [Candidatus Enterococcus mansonii]|uniref:Uncharacterized protein n=1 Tax=Candidatus Enterococcus mansonii TaxID=1834181 RepID=A0A242CH37_9ENTE|nr:hypothetical protein [Enterococcus sp. 4G2_DIV0659]OTO09438.1 hypothetical protein A5880_000117 [Enterococcus sp. 4G2_DIV0659]
MGTNLLIILYFLVVVIVVLALVMVRDKQFLRHLLAKKDMQQEEITNLKLERVRLKHIIKMQDETIAHMLTSNTQYSKRLEYSAGSFLEEDGAQEWHLDNIKSMQENYYEV